MLLHDAIDNFQSENDPQIKRALLVLCNALYNKAMCVNKSISRPTHTIPNKTYDQMARDYILTEAEINTGKQFGKINCLKAFRARVDESLINAKRFVEGYFDEFGYHFRM